MFEFFHAEARGAIGWTPLSRIAATRRITANMEMTTKEFAPITCGWPPADTTSARLAPSALPVCYSAASASVWLEKIPAYFAMPTIVNTFAKWGDNPNVLTFWPEFDASISIWITSAIPLELM